MAQATSSMPTTKLLRSFFLLFFLQTASLNGQAHPKTDTTATKPQHDGHALSVEAGFVPSHVLALDKYVRKWLKRKNSTAFYLQLNRSAIPGSGNNFDSDYNYPSLSAGIRLSLNHGVTMRRDADQNWGGHLTPVDYTSRLGNAITAYGLFSRPIVRTKRWEAGYQLGMGAGYFNKKYNQTDDIDNELIGSHLNIYFTAGIYCQYQITQQWAAKAGVDFAHHSNGALHRPNKGANYLGPFAALVFRPYQPHEPKAHKPNAHTPFKQYWITEFALGFGGKTLLEDWQRTQFRTPPDCPDYRTSRFPVYGAFSLQASLLYRYARRWASGIGLDVFYGDYAQKVARLDKAVGYTDEPHSPWSVGIALKHEVFYGNLSARMGIGWYLYRHMGVEAKDIERKYYERIGLFYTPPCLGGLSVGLSVNAHATKADFTELVISMPIKLGRHASPTTLATAEKP